MDLHSVESPGNVFPVLEQLVILLKFLFFFLFFFFYISCCCTYSQFLTGLFFFICSPRLRPAAHSLAKMSAHLRPLARSPEIKNPPAPLFFLFFFRGGVGLCLWLANGREPLWLEQSIVEKCMKLYALPFSQILRKICHCQLLRNTLTKKV